jgi:hypothetical protein
MNMFPPKIIGTGLLESVGMYRDIVFSTSYNIGS